MPSNAADGLAACLLHANVDAWTGTDRGAQGRGAVRARLHENDPRPRQNSGGPQAPMRW